MLFSSIFVLVLLGVSLITFAKLRQKPTSGHSAYARPPAGWPDVPVHSLGLFQREGTINAPMPRTCARKARRFRSFDATQDFVVAIMEHTPGPLPKVALQLSDIEGPDWTDVMLNGQLVAHVQTSALTADVAMRH